MKSTTTALNISSFVNENVPTDVAMNAIIELMANGFEISKDGKKLVSGWGSISNNHIIEVKGLVMDGYESDDQFLCVLYHEHREQWPGYHFIDGVMEYDGGTTYDHFKEKFIDRKKW